MSGTVTYKLKKCLKQMGRTKNMSQAVQEKSELGKVLSTIDLTALGIGCTLGVGVYVLPGLVAKTLAGPAVIVSFFITAIVSMLAGLCFAEFGARVPKAGSAYIYSYVTMGEFVAFTIGWALILEYVIGTASVARGLSSYIDTLLGNRMETFYRSIYDLEHSAIMSEYFDIFAFSISIIVTLGLAYGVKESLLLNNLLTTVNIGVVLFVLIVGSMYIRWENWSLPESDVPDGAGEGGFFPFGVMGAIKGASTCLYGYVGFDVIATSGEEVNNPTKAVPMAIISSLFIVFFAYSGISGILTLMWPYYAQDTEAPIPFVFTSIGLNWATWVVAIGGIFGLLASLFSGMFPLPRIIYSMANDGLLYRNLGDVHPKYRTPFKGTLIAGAMTGLMGGLFKLKDLVDLMVIATLLTYTIVSASVLLLRYREEQEEHSITTPLLGTKRRSGISCCQICHQLFTYRSVSTPTRVSSAAAAVVIILYCILCIALSNVLLAYEEELILFGTASLVFAITLAIGMVLLLFLLSIQPSDTSKLPFTTPLVPFVPGASIFANIYLMMLLDSLTWLRFIVWMVFGYLIYFSYGLWESSQRRKDVPFQYDNLQSDIETLDEKPKL